MFALECPSALTMIDITLVLVFHILLILIYTSLYLLSFSISFSWMLALSGMALPISRHVLSQLYITMSNYCCQCEDFVWNAPMVLVGHLYSQVLPGTWSSVWSSAQLMQGCFSMFFWWSQVLSAWSWAVIMGLF